MQSKYWSVLLLTLGLLLVVSCSTSRPQGETKAEVLYKEAQDYVEKERFLLATEKLNLIKSQHPYSLYAAEAELLLADIYYLQENYEEAAASYKLFLEFHPKHAKREHVLWRVAESYFLQLPSTDDRDLGPGVPAKNYYQQLVNEFPKTENANKAVAKIAEIEQREKNKELYVANFYYKTERFESAMSRYLTLLERYPEDDQLAELAMERILKSTIELKLSAECAQYAEQFIGRASNDKMKNNLMEWQQKCPKKE